MEGIVRAATRIVRMSGERKGRKPIVAATVEVTDLMRQWWDEERSERFGPWAYVCEVFIDPPELIVDDGDGDLFRQPFTIDGDTITFEDAVLVKRQYVNARHVAASERGGQERLATYASHEDAVCATFPGEQQPEEADVKVNPKILAKLGLAETATEDEVNAALEAQLLAEDEPELDADGNPVTAPPAEQAPVTEQAPAAPAQVAAGTKIPDGFQLVDSDAWKATQERLQKVEAGAKKLEVAERDEFLKGAVKAGKFPPASLAKYQGLWDTDPEGTRSLVASLAAGTIPVIARGVEEGTEADSGPAYPAWMKQAGPVAASATTPDAPAHVRTSGGLTVINA